MKPYGVDRSDAGCCPGHDKFPSDTYSTSRSKRAQARDTKLAHGRARARSRAEIIQRELEELELAALDEDWNHDDWK